MSLSRFVISTVISLKTCHKQIPSRSVPARITFIKCIELHVLGRKTSCQDDGKFPSQALSGDEVVDSGRQLVSKRD